MIIMFLAEGFEETEAVFPLDLMRRAGLDARTVSITENKAVRSAHGVILEADMTAAELGCADVEGVVLPGGMPGALNLKNSPVVIETLKKCAASGGVTAAICAAPIVLGAAGLLVGKKAICYPGHEDGMIGASVKRRAVVVDGKVVTAIGPGAAAEFGLTLVSVFAGNAVAGKVERGILPV